jgi:hypothetical protein
MVIQGRKDDYKVKTIVEIMEGMFYDEYYKARLKGEDTKAINIDDAALALLQAYYEGQRIIIEGVEQE